MKTRENASEAELKQMGQMLAHRGPDDSGIHMDGPMGMVHKRLSIIDLSGGHQPLVSADRRLSLVANGEIYNFVELRKELQARGCVFQTRSDSETILHAYSIFGKDFTGRLHGMYAFALFDADKQELILVRDRLGIKPLYYVQLSDRIAFASEIKALLPILKGCPEIDPTAFVQYLQKAYISGEETLIKGVKRVMPGESVIVDRSPRAGKEKYWSILDVKPIHCSFEEAREMFDDLIRVVMREHVRSDVPYGLFLSGGTDSAVLLSQLVQYQDSPIRTFSIGYESTEKRNELDDAERMAKRFKTEHTSFLLSDEMLLTRIPYMVWATDDLMQDYACLPTSILAEEAAKELKVVFTGEGGDEVFAGYNRYRKPCLRRLKSRLLRPRYRGIKIKGRWPKGSAAETFGPDLKALRNAFKSPFKIALQSMPGEWSFLQHAQGNDILGELLNRFIVKVDRMLMSFGLEGRVPWLDHRIVSFGLALPDALKINRHEGKIFLKVWSEGKIPHDHLYLKKRGFHMPAEKLLSGAFLARLEDKLVNNDATLSWFVDDGVKEIFARQKTRGDRSTEVWSLMQFAIWHHLFVEHPGRKPSLQEQPLDWIS
ncbi:MAG: asparagine synthase (glutamine-hydrolyzing) [Proteobacteria bacterium]|nr:asparagine synthase (glutamine-hydrolyzing) [Pseudomonadota bacterium]